MPRYTVTDPQTGRKVTLTGDSPPTEQELEQVFSSIPAPKADFSGVTGGVQTNAGDKPVSEMIKDFAVGHLRGDTQQGVLEGLKQAGIGAGQLIAQGGLTGVLAQKFGDLIGAPDPSINPQQAVSDYLGNVSQDSQQQFDMTQAGQNPAGKFGQVVGETAPSLVVPGGQATIPARIGMAGLGGVVAGAVQPVTNGNFADEKLKQVAIAGGTSALGQGVVGEPLAWGAGRVASMLSKDVQPAISDTALAAKQYADQNKLPIYYDDLTNSTVARKAGTLIDDIPYIGGGGSRAAQEKAARAHAESVVGKYETQSSGRAAETIAQSAEDKLSQAKQIKNKLYREAFTDLNKSGEFDLGATKKEAERLLQIELTKGKLADQGLVNELQKYKDAPKFNFEGWHEIRSGLGSKIRSKQTGDNAVLSDRATAALQRLKGAMDSELNQVASKTGGAAKWRRADSFYAQTMPKYRQGVIADLLKSKNPDAIAEKIIGTQGSGGTKSEGLAREVYNGLNKTGRQEVKFALLNRALQKSIKTSESAGEHFSPAQFSKELNDMDSRLNVFFPKGERQAIDGLKMYMESIKRAGQYAANPPTGNRIAQMAVLASPIAAYATPTIGVPAISATVISNALLRTQRGKNLLLRLGATSPASNTAQQIIQEINSMVSKASASQASRQSTPQAEGMQQQQRVAQ